jgi:hypothetical protein
MRLMYYIVLDVHKRKISYWAKDSGGKVCAKKSRHVTGNSGTIRDFSGYQSGSVPTSNADWMSDASPALYLIPITIDSGPIRCSTRPMR